MSDLADHDAEVAGDRVVGAFGADVACQEETRLVREREGGKKGKEDVSEEAFP